MRPKTNACGGRRLLSLACCCILGAAPSAAQSPVCTGYPEPRIWLESQAWWDSTGLVIPSRVGEHIHVGMCWPTDSVGGDALLRDSLLRVDVRVMLHAATGKTNWLRVAAEASTSRSVILVIGPAADTTVWVPFVINLKTWGTGRREFRWTANIPRNAEGKRQYQSTGWQACVRACSPTYRTGPWTEARGWYTGHDYQNARFLSRLPLQPVAGLWTFRVRLVQSGPGGVFIDPDFHAGIAGTRVAAGGFSGLVTVDTRTLTNGAHRLVLVASDGKSAGVQVIAFTVLNP